MVTQLYLVSVITSTMVNIATMVTQVTKVTQLTNITMFTMATTVTMGHHGLYTYGSIPVIFCQ